jgi:hypothetical protein
MNATFGGAMSMVVNKPDEHHPTGNIPAKRFNTQRKAQVVAIQKAPWDPHTIEELKGPPKAGFRSYLRIVEEIDRGVALKQYVQDIKDDTIAYNSWLQAYAAFNDDPSLYRKFAVVKQRLDGSLYKKTVHVNKVQATFLEEGDHWGPHGIEYDADGAAIDAPYPTRDTYFAKERRSSEARKRRKEEAKSKGLTLVEGTKPLPPYKTWNNSMSRQKPLEGLRSLNRPPTLDELWKEHGKLVDMYSFIRCRGRYDPGRNKTVHEFYYDASLMGRTPLDRLVTPYGKVEQIVTEQIEASNDSEYIVSQNTESFIGPLKSLLKPNEVFVGQVFATPLQDLRITEKNIPDPCNKGYMIAPPRKEVIDYSVYDRHWKFLASPDYTNDEKLYVECVRSVRSTRAFKSVPGIVYHAFVLYKAKAYQALPDDSRYEKYWSMIAKLSPDAKRNMRRAVYIEQINIPKDEYNDSVVFWSYMVKCGKAKPEVLESVKKRISKLREQKLDNLNTVVDDTVVEKIAESYLTKQDRDSIRDIVQDVFYGDSDRKEPSLGDMNIVSIETVRAKSEDGRSTIYIPSGIVEVATTFSPASLFERCVSKAGVPGVFIPEFVLRNPELKRQLGWHI